MPSYIALLRSVNVGGKNSLPMADLRALLESLDLDAVRTYIQSGNALFDTRKKMTAAAIEDAIAERFGRRIDVVLRTSTDLERTLARNPFPKADTSKVHVGFMAEPPPKAAVKSVDRERFLPEEFAAIARDVYFHLPNGMGRSKLAPYVTRAIKAPMTVRNWSTVAKLLELAS